KPDPAEIEKQAGPGHLWNGDVSAAEDDGVGRRGHREHEGAGSRNRGGYHEQVGMDLEYGAGGDGEYRKKNIRCGRVAGDLGQKRDQQCDGYHYNEGRHTGENGELVANPTDKAAGDEGFCKGDTATEEQ